MALRVRDGQPPKADPHESSRRFQRTKRLPMVACGGYPLFGDSARGMAALKIMGDPADGAAVVYTVADIDREELPIV